jgi:hypothetical protein
MEAPIGTVEVGSAAEYLRMTIQRRLNLVFIAGVSIQDFLICNPARSTFGQKDLGAELDRGEYFATLDHIGVGFKDRVDLLGRGDLFSLQHTASRWIDDAVSQLAIMFDLLARLVAGQLVDHALAACGLGLLDDRARRVHNLLSDVDELAVFLGLLLLPLLGRHWFDLWHATAGRPGTVVEPFAPAQARRLKQDRPGE